ncbi:MAG: zinc-binding dehydrogenase [Candidatus Competibacteraceae bacterium]
MSTDSEQHDFSPLAALPETFFTVWSNVFERARLQPGETFLVHGGTSGIGTTAIQLAHAWGAHVITTVGAGNKVAACKELGADLVINYQEADFVPVVREATQRAGRGCDPGYGRGDYVQRNLSVLAVEGRLVQIAFLRGAKVSLNLALS